MVKYGLIDDEEFFFWLEDNQAEIFAGGPARGEAIARCCAHKARVVSRTKRRLGVRALLNLGHTFGHALEKDTGYSDRLLHGEGVAIGMVLAHGFSAQPRPRPVPGHRPHRRASERVRPADAAGRHPRRAGLRPKP